MNATRPNSTSTITFKVERVPTYTRNQFKSACAADGLNMRDVIISFMDEYGEFSAACAQQGVSAVDVLSELMQRFRDQEQEMSQVA